MYNMYTIISCQTEVEKESCVSVYVVTVPKNRFNSLLCTFSKIFQVNTEV